MNEAIMAWMRPEPGQFADLIGQHKGEIAFILGGGSSLPDSHKTISKTKKPHIKISVNSHGVRLTSCDYVVFLDYKQVSAQLDALGDKAPRITWHREHADYLMIDHWHASNSAKVAVWCAWQMGCYPIVLLGIDCYGTDKPTYWHDADAISSGKTILPTKHAEDWDRDIRQVIPQVRPYLRAIGSPLDKVFGAYDKTELFTEPPDLPKREQAAPDRNKPENGVLIRFLVGMKHKHVIYQPNEVSRVDEPFAQWALVRRRAVLWEGDPPKAQSPFEPGASDE